MSGLLRQSRHGTVLHGVRKGRNPETGVYPECAAYSCKSLQQQISMKIAEIPPTFQRAFLNRECGSSNPPRSARQSGSRRKYPSKERKARFWRAFSIGRRSLNSQIGELAGCREKSPATTANIPIFGRLSLETRFDLHCVRDAAVAFAIFSDPYRASWGTPVLNCRLRAAVDFQH